VEGEGRVRPQHAHDRRQDFKQIVTKSRLTPPRGESVFLNKLFTHHRGDSIDPQPGGNFRKCFCGPPRSNVVVRDLHDAVYLGRCAQERYASRSGRSDVEIHEHGRLGRIAARLHRIDHQGGRGGLRPPRLGGGLQAGQAQIAGGGGWGCRDLAEHWLLGGHRRAGVGAAVPLGVHRRCGSG